METTNEELSRLLIETTKRFTALLEKSEERIDRTNEMVSKLAESIICLRTFSTDLESAYEKYLDKACAGRDAAQNESRELLLMLKDERKRYNDLLKHLISIASSTHENNINVKQ